MNALRIKRALVAGTLATLASAGCGGDATSPNANAGLNDIAGTFTLQTVAGRADGVAKPLPATHPTLSGGTMTFASGTLTVNTNGSYTISGPYTATPSGAFNLNRTGAVTRSGNTLTFTQTNNPNYSGTVSGSAIAVTMAATPSVDLLVFTFRK